MNNPSKKAFSFTKLLRLLCTGLEALIVIGLVVTASLVPFADSFLSAGSSIRISKSPATGAFSYDLRLSRSHNVHVTNDASVRGAGAGDDQGVVTVGPFSFEPGIGDAFLKGGEGVEVRDVVATVAFKGPQKALDALRAFKWPALASELCAILGGLAFIETLRRLLASAEKGEMFTEANARTLWQVGILMIALDLVKFAATVVLLGRMHSFVAPFFADGTWMMMTTFTGKFTGVITGLAFFLVAAVFREGLRFRRDSDLTI